MLNISVFIQKANRAKFGQGTGPVLLSEMKCTGEEKSLLDCPHSGWGQNSCDHGRDAGVSCLEQGKDEYRSQKLSLRVDNFVP